MIEMVLFLAYILWLALVANAWYIMLIPFWIGSAIGLYRRSFKFPLIGLAASFILSWIVAFVAVFCVRFN